MSDRGDPPQVSFVMPVYRPRVDWLKLAVGSALRQTGCTFELIVVDDGCSPPVEDLLSGRRDPRLRFVRGEHRGASVARNIGAKVARGRWVRFLDADDAYEAGSTERLLALAGGDLGILAYGATTFCDADLRPIWTMTSRIEGDALVPCLLGGFTVRPQSLLFPRDLVEAVGGWEPTLSIAHDWDLVLRVLEHVRVRGERRVATYYRRHSGGLTSDVEVGVGEARRVVSHYFERHPDALGSPLERRAEAMLRALAARVNISQGQFGPALREAGASLARDSTALLGEGRRSLPALRGHAARWAQRRIPHRSA